MPASDPLFGRSLAEFADDRDSILLARGPRVYELSGESTPSPASNAKALINENGNPTIEAMEDILAIHSSGMIAQRSYS